MSMLIKLYRADVECLIEHVAPDSDLRQKLCSSKLLIPKESPIETPATAIVCSEAEERELLLIAQERCSHAVVHEIQRGMTLCGCNSS